MSKKIRHRAEMIILSPNCKEVLLVRNNRGLSVFPGGGIDNGSTPLETATREAKEEAGACVKNVKSLNFIYERTNLLTAYRRDRKYFIGSLTHFFIGDFDHSAEQANHDKEKFVLEWVGPMDAIRLICHNNWRYDEALFEPLLTNIFKGRY